MATINHSSGADIIVPSNNGTTYRGLGGDDTYILSNSIAANAAITIVDTSGANKIQLVNGLSVASTKFAADAVQLTLSNGAVVTINGASNFDFDLGGNATAGTSGSVTDFAGFAAGAGVSALPSSGSVAGASNVSVQGTAWSGGTGGSYTVTKSGSSVDEGSSVTFTITASSAVSADTTFSWTVIGDSNGSTVDKAGTSDIDVLSGTATIAAGASSTTFEVTASSDSVVEGIEGIKVSVFDSSSNALSSDTILVNNSGSAATSQSFTMTTGVNEQVGGSGNDTYDASTTVNSLNDFDNIDGAGGTDTVVAKLSGADAGVTVAPVMNNIEQVSITFTDTTADEGAADKLTVNLAEATSINKVMNVTSNEAVFFDNLTNLTALEVKSAQNTTTLNYDYQALGGDDNQLITVKGTNGTDITLDDDNPLNSSVIETVTVNSISVANTLDSLDTSAVNTTSLVVTGDKKLTITAALDADIVSIDASGSTGGLTLSADPGAANFTVVGSSAADSIVGDTGNVNVSGGAGNDTLTMAGTWNGLDVYDGGDGTDTLAVSANFAPINTGPTSANTIAAGLSNVEILKVTGDGTTVTFDKNMGSLSTIDISDATNDQIVNLNDGYTGDTTVIIGSATSASNRDAEEKIVNTANVDLSVYAKVGDIDGSTASKTTITGGYGQDTLYLYNVASGDTTAVLSGTADSIARVDKIVILDGTAGNDVTITTGDYALTSALGAVLPLTIDATAMGATEVLTVTGTGATAKLNILAGDASDDLTGGSAADTISGGAGNDTIDANTGSGNVIDGGAGNDTITTGEGIDNISGGAGNDTINAEDNLKLDDTIDGGDGTDTLTIDAAVSSSTVFGSVSNIEVIKPLNAIDITANGTLGGAQTFDLSSAGNNTLTLTAGKWTGDTTVNLSTTTEDGSGNSDDVINAANVALTVNSRDDDVDSTTTLTGGTGTDILNLTATGDATGSVLTAVTGFEQINVVDAVTAGTSIKITPNLTTTAVQNIDASELDGSTQNDEVLTLAGEGAAGKLNITGGGGNDAITGGGANDTIVGNDGIDAINGNAGADNISGGAGNDVITIDSKAEYTSAVGTDTIDGGAGTDKVDFNAVMNLAASQLGSISNTETWEIEAGSEFVISDDVLTSNPGLTFSFLGSGTLSGGEDTAGAALMTESINFTASAAGDMKLIGSSGDDTFTFSAAGTYTTADTIDGNAGTDIIYLLNNTSPGGADGTGNALTAGASTQVTFGANTKGIEKIIVTDLAADYAGDVDIAISDGYTDTSLEIDGSSLDVNPTDESDGEYLKVVSSDANTALTVTGGAGRDTITGGGAADSISGGSAVDSLTGGGGNDTISGGSGADVIEGGAGADNISGGSGNDTIKVTDADYSDFKTSGGVETVDGGEGTDVLTFNTGDNNALTLTAPELSKLTSIEAITMVTGTAAATLTFGNETFDNLGNPSLSLTSNTGSGVTTIDGSAVSNGSFLIINDIGADTADKYVGGSGDDIFRFDGTAGLKANDTVTGNGGSDTVQLDASAGAVTAVLDLDTTSVEKVVVYAGATGVEAGQVTLQLGENGTAALNAYTSPGLDIDLSGAVNTTVAGAVVNYTESGNSTFDFDNADITGELIKAPLTITGTVKADTIMGSAGNDTIIATNSTLTADKLVGGDGNDTITAGSGADQLGGGAGNDNLDGGGGNDTLYGAAGNDILVGGDGSDRIDGEGGLDTITLGAGTDTVVYDAAADSSGSLKDVITDFNQSEINATTGVTTTAGDNIEIAFGTITATTWALSDKGDVENGGLAAAAIDGVQGSFVFADDTSTIYLDFNGDGFLNTADLQITVTGLTSFHSNDINASVTASNSASTLTGGSGDDTITGGTAADSLYGGLGNDTIASGNTGAVADKIYGQGGNDTLSNGTGSAATTLDGGTGNDTLTGSDVADLILTGGTGDDLFDLEPVDTAEVHNITDFESAGAVVGDVIRLDADNTTVTTAVGAAPVIGTITATQTTEETAYGTFASGASNSIDLLIVTATNAAGTLASDTADGTNLLTDFIVDPAAGVTVVAGAKFYILAYDAGNAYLYYAESANTNLIASEILPIAKIDSITANALIADDFILG